MGITKAEYDLKIGTGELDKQLVGAGLIPAIWYKPASGVTTAVQAEAQLHVAPIVITRNCTLDRIAAEVTSAGTAGAVVRLGIWADNGRSYPGFLLLDAGTIDGTSATIQAKTISLPITAGLYWIGGATQGGAGTRPTMRVYNSTLPHIGNEGANPNFTNAFPGYSQASVSGAFSERFSSTVAFSGAATATMIRASA